MRAPIFTSFFCATLAAAPVAGAAPPSPPLASAASPEAIATFKNGIELYQEGDYQASLHELRRAYALAPTYRMLFNIGQVCFELKDYACALASFQAYLKEGGEAVPEARRASIEQDLERLRARVASVEVAMTTDGVE